MNTDRAQIAAFGRSEARMSDLDDVVRWYESSETPWPYRTATPEPQPPCPDTIPCSAPDSDEGGLDP